MRGGLNMWGRFVCMVGLAAAIGACAAISGLDGYRNGDCDGCAGTDSDSGSIDDAATAPDMAVGTTDSLGAASEDAPEASDETQATDDANDAGCASGLIDCDGSCVPSTSASTCGSCGIVCGDGSTCHGGVCTSQGSDGCGEVALPPSVNVDVSQ